MKFGFFDDANKEYVITNPRTPYPWINYLGTQEFFSLISNTAGGYSFFKDARLRRITRYRYNNVPVDMGGRYFYINDEGTVWNPGWSPVKTELDSYSCRHGMGYTIIKGSKNGLEAEVSFLTITVRFRRLFSRTPRTSPRPSSSSPSSSGVSGTHRTTARTSRETSTQVRLRSKAPLSSTRQSIRREEITSHSIP